MTVFAADVGAALFVKLVAGASGCMLALYDGHWSAGRAGGLGCMCLSPLL